MNLTFCMTAWIVTAVVVQTSPGPSRERADTKELSRLEQVWDDAHVSGDADALDRLWADDLIVTVPEMPPLAKTQTIGVWRSGRMKFQRYETSDTRIRVYGDAAVVTGRVKRSRTIANRTVDDDWQFTKVYVRRADEWLVVAFHASQAPPPPGR